MGNLRAVLEVSLQTMPTASNATLGAASLLSTTPDSWIQAVLGDFDAFLLDHAACERKASAMAMTFLVRYPDRDAILEPMILLAREELAHFHAVFKLLQARGLHFVSDSKDPYLNALLPQLLLPLLLPEPTLRARVLSVSRSHGSCVLPTGVRHPG